MAVLVITAKSARDVRHSFIKEFKDDGRWQSTLQLKKAHTWTDRAIAERDRKKFAANAPDFVFNITEKNNEK